MLLRNDEQGWNELNATINNYFTKKNRQVFVFSSPSPKCGNSLEFCFLIDRKHIVKYCIGIDRDTYLGVLLFAIGPHYFSSAQFWSYENSQRFTLEASTEGVEKNLRLLDEFLGYPPALPGN